MHIYFYVYIYIYTNRISVQTEFCPFLKGLGTADWQSLSLLLPMLQLEQSWPRSFWITYCIMLTVMSTALS